MSAKPPVILVSMDGVGAAAPGPGNAVTLAKTPNLDKLWPTYPHTYLEASGEHVGLPPGSDGNSEVGHAVMGAGKVLFQDVARIDNAIEDKTFLENPELLGAFRHAMQSGGNVHLLGMIGDSKNHSSLGHLYALLRMALKQKWDPDKLFIHAISDGRDSAPHKAIDLVGEIMDECLTLRMGRIVSLVGRFYAMDRDRRWDRIKLAYEMYTQGKAHVVIDWSKWLAQNYAKGTTDEFIEPTVLVLNDKDSPVLISENDAVIFFNFRPDRATEITRAFTDNAFTGFERQKLNNLYFVGMTKYADGLEMRAAFPPDKVENFLGKVLSDNQFKQLRIAESEKFAHVTYFFNNGYREALPGEAQVEVPSPRDVLTYDQKPEMSQRLVTDILLEKLNTNAFDFAVVNFAGPDMVGHTGNLQASIQTMEVVDECIGRITKAVLDLGGTVIITADHGNAEEMIDLDTGEPDNNHSTNPVPCIIVGKQLPNVELPIGNLSDIAPTVLGLLGIAKPAEMTGRNLLQNIPLVQLAEGV